MVNAAKGTERAQLLAREKLGRRRNRRQWDPPRLAGVEPLLGGATLERRHEVHIDLVGVQEAPDRCPVARVLPELGKLEELAEAPPLGGVSAVTPIQPSFAR